MPLSKEELENHIKESIPDSTVNIEDLSKQLKKHKAEVKLLKKVCFNNKVIK